MAEYAIIETGGKQYRVAAGDELVVERLQGEAGDGIVFDRVLLLGGAKPRLGCPLVEGAKVAATIVAQARAEKILVFKKKRRKNSRKLHGHRQPLTQVRIEEIRA